jgi:hypothetical protein
MSDFSNTESSRVSSLIPQQLLSDAEALIEILQEYYKFINTEDTGPSNILNSILYNKDLDRVVDAFIDLATKEIGAGFVRNFTANKKLLYKNIQELYQSKGSLDSIKTLFRILFGVEIEITLPKDQLLIASDGRWSQQNVIFVDVSSGNPFDAVNEFIKINNTSGSVVDVEIERVRRTGIGDIYEVTISKSFRGTIQVGATINDTNFVGTLVNALGLYEIEYAGQFFEVGQILNISNGEADSSETKVKITEVDSNGGIVAFEFLEFGVGYVGDFVSYVIPRGYDSSFSTELEDADYVGSINDRVKTVEGGMIEIDSYSLGYFAEEYLTGQRVFGSYGSVYASDEVDLENIDDVDEALDAVEENYPTRAIIRFTNTPLAKYAGLYSTNNGFLSDAIYLQDNRYYQQYSYVIRSSQQYDTYKNILRRTMHPAGFEFFGQYEINNTFDVSTALQALERFYRERLNDAVDTSDLAVKLVQKPVTDEVLTSQAYEYLLQKNLEDTTTNSDDYSSEFGKNVSDTQTTSDAIQDIAFTKGLSDTTTSSELLSRASTKPLTDTATATESHGIAFSTSFADTATATDSTQLLSNPNVISDVEAVSDNISDIAFTKNETDTVSATESIDIQTGTNLSDSINTSESGTINFNPYSVGYFAQDYTEGLSSF